MIRHERSIINSLNMSRCLPWLRALVRFSWPPFSEVSDTSFLRDETLPNLPHRGLELHTALSHSLTQAANGGRRVCQSVWTS